MAQEGGNGPSARLVIVPVCIAIFAAFFGFLVFQSHRIVRQMEKPGLPWGDPGDLVVFQTRAESRGLFLTVPGVPASSVTRGSLGLQSAERGPVFWNWQTTPPTRVVTVPWRAFGRLKPMTIAIRGLSFPTVSVKTGGVDISSTVSRRRPDGKLRTLGALPHAQLLDAPQECSTNPLPETPGCAV